MQAYQYLCPSPHTPPAFFNVALLTERWADRPCGLTVRTVAGSWRSAKKSAGYPAGRQADTLLIILYISLHPFVYKASGGSGGV